MTTDIENKKLLIVDDDELIVSLLSDYFSGLGYEVFQAYHAEEAIDKLNNGNKINLVLTDINLPGRSGLELLKIVNETKEDIPVILLTGLKTLDTALSALKSGAADYITKPFELGMVRKVVEKTLRKQRRVLNKEKIYENILNMELNFRFTSAEMNPDAVAKALIEILNRMQFSSEEELKQYELAFTETLINSVEHGNLELPSSIKSDDYFQIAEFEELKEKRLSDPQYSKRKIDVSFRYGAKKFTLCIKDEGPGFAWREFFDEKNQMSSVNMSSHGRGFTMIRHIMDEIRFNDTGNQITLIKTRPQ